MRALSIRQPWAWLIVHGHKPVENRDWCTTWRGPLLVHAGASVVKRDFREAVAQVQDLFDIAVPELDALPRGGIVGMATLHGCVQEMDSPWFTGPHGLLLRDARPLPFVPWKGVLGFFHVPASEAGVAPEIAGGW
jgi:hypothetical protein